MVKLNYKKIIRINLCTRSYIGDKKIKFKERKTSRPKPETDDV